MATTTLQQSTREKYDEILPVVCEQFGVKNKFAAPRITKVCLNMGVGRAIADGQILNIVSEHLSLLAGQRSSITIAKKAVAQFRSREGNKIGAKVTLRGPKMWNFLDKLIHLAIPRIRDFRGLSRKGFDKQGNYSLGLTEQALFPEVDLDRLEHNQGLSVVIVIENSNAEKSLELIKGIGMPLREK